MVLPVSLKRTSQGGTLSRPARDQSIMACSKVLYRHISQKEFKNESEEQHLFDIDHYIRKSYVALVPALAKTHAFTIFSQKPKVNVMPEPDVQKIYQFIKRIFDRARLHAEAVIIALIYIERLLKKRNTCLDARNWIPVVVTSLLTASKMWDDHSSYNAEFAAIVPVFSLPDLNELERRFLGALNYTFSISASEYARYYFGLRSLSKQSVQQRSIPKYYMHLGLNVHNGQKVEQKLRTEIERYETPMSL